MTAGNESRLGLVLSEFELHYDEQDDDRQRDNNYSAPAWLAVRKLPPVARTAPEAEVFSLG